MSEYDRNVTQSKDLPAVSYIMPVLNEEAYLERAVRQILQQRYPADVEIVIALGPSTDSTNDIAQALASEDSRIKLINNPERDIPIALNLAISHSSHPVIVRVDAHSDLSENYTETAVRSLMRSGAVNVGGIMRAAGRGKIQEAIARGYNSPYGLGGGTYHGSGTPRAAESAYLGVFWRDAVCEVGGYDPTIRRGEDWELNLRLRQAGHTVWFDPSLEVTYWPRHSWSALAKQFFATGVWRAVITKKYPRETPWRFFVPGTLVLMLALTVLLVLAQATRLFGRWWSFFYVIPGAYLLGVLFAVSQMPQQRRLGTWARSYWALTVMHLTWGAGFITGTVRGGGDTVDRSRAR
jgi:succinoglycan biosynthesis protein ExoA